MSSINNISSLLPSIGGTSSSGSSNSLLSTITGSESSGQDIVTLTSQIAINAISTQYSQAAQSPTIYTQEQADEYNAMVNEAVAALQSGDLDLAKEKTQLLLKRDYTDAIAYHMLARIAQVEGDYDQAISYFETAAELNPDDEDYQNDLFNARQLLRSDEQVLSTAKQLASDYNTATQGMELLMELAERTDDKAPAYLALAETFEEYDIPVQQLYALEEAINYGNENDLQAAESMLKEFISEHEPVGYAYSLLGGAQQRLGKYEEAMGSYEQARTIAPETERYTEELANVYAVIGSEKLEAGELSSAEHYFEEARALDPTNEDIKFGMAAVLVSRAKDYVAQGLSVKARSSLGRATSLLGSDESLDTEIATAYYRLGLRSKNEDMNNLAILDFERAYARDPDIAGLKRNLANMYYERAMGVINDEEHETMQDLGMSEFESVIEDLQGAFDLYGTRSDYREALGNALNEFGLKLMNTYEKYERAVEILGRAKELYPDNAEYAANYQQALQLHLDNPEEDDDE